jgi:hypothetical protein
MAARWEEPVNLFNRILRGNPNEDTVTRHDHRQAMINAWVSAQQETASTPDYDGDPAYTETRRTVAANMARGGRTATMPREVANYIENLLTGILRHDRTDDTLTAMGYHPPTVAGVRQAVSDSIDASDAAHRRNGGSEHLPVESLTPPAVLYERDDVDETATACLSVLAEVRRMVVDYRPVTADPLADFLAILDAAALSCAPDDDDDDDDDPEAAITEVEAWIAATLAEDPDGGPRD